MSKTSKGDANASKEWGYDYEKGEFNTAKEAEYPRALCEQYANILEHMVFGSLDGRHANVVVDKMLGVVVDTSDNTAIKVDNKESRKRELVGELQNILRAGSLDASNLAPVLGRIQYAEMRISGRRAMADIREWEKHEGSKKNLPLDDISRAAFELLLARVNSGKPQHITVDEPQRPILIFTDGAVETGAGGEVEATIGGVIFADTGTHVFGAHVDAQVLQSWMEELVHPVGLTELYGIVVALERLDENAESHLDGTSAFCKQCGGFAKSWQLG
ncbi:unnamed protein product [Cladocopium goreaui]|uniref:Uncharacterized protein n=1 Tax=Cladocopium goreaui TaxID=2562237 RepID=A0A9P1BWA4_9DINO|nr:unnamed protein product [Cladocopium goreaui]